MCLTFPQMPENLTATESAILEYICAHRDEFLFMTIAELAAALHVSEASISRFARRVGCRDFKHLKQVVLAQGERPGAARKLANTLAEGETALLPRWIEQQRANLEKTLELLDKAEFDRAVQAIVAAQRVYLHAKNASRALVELLAYRLRRIGVEVERLPAGGSELLEGLAGAGAGDLVVLFGFSKLSAEARVLLDHSAAAGYRTLLFTARQYPAHSAADIRLTVYRGEEDEYHSMTAPAAVADALVLAVSARKGPAAVARLESVRTLKQQYGNRL